MKLRLKLGEMNATLLSHHNSFVYIANAIFGDGKDKGGAPSQLGKDPDRVDLAAGHSSVESAVAAINQAMRFG